MAIIFFLYLKIIINVLVSSFRFISIPMLWVYGQYKNVIFFTATIDFKSQNLTSIDRRQILTSEVGPRINKTRFCIWFIQNYFGALRDNPLSTDMSYWFPRLFYYTCKQFLSKKNYLNVWYQWTLWLDRESTEICLYKKRIFFIWNHHKCLVSSFKKLCYMLLEAVDRGSETHLQVTENFIQESTLTSESSIPALKWKTFKIIVDL